MKEFIELKIERMSFGPAAVGRYLVEGNERPVVVFVRGAAPGDRIQAEITKRHKNFWEARLVKVLEPSPVRVAPPCPVVDACGGCQWQHLSYPAQVEAKAEVLLHQLSRVTHTPSDELKTKLTSHAAQNPFGYRARVQARGNAHSLGFFKEGSRDLVPVKECAVLHPAIQNQWTQFAASKPLAELSKPKGQFKVEWTLTESGQILESINKDHAALGFTQINPEQNEVLVSVVNAATKKAGRGTLLDLYGGSGNLSQGVVSHFDYILCVETNGPGSPAGKIEAPLKKGTTHVREDVTDFTADQLWSDWSLSPVTCIIADPPRSGLGPAASAISAVGAEYVILVSCDPSTLARDLPEFLSNYTIDAIHLVDMFPQTYHIESVIILRKN